MKKIILSILVFSFILSAYAQKKETFDQTIYTAPKGWQKSSKAETVTYTKEVAGKGFCIITLYKSIDASADAKQNFSMAWDALVKQQLPVDKLEILPSATENGWQAESGQSAFEKENIKGVATLIATTGNSKLVNILIISNTDTYQTEVNNFLASVSFKKIAATNNNTPATAAVPSANKSKIKPELWVNRRLIATIDGIMDRHVKTITDFIVIYPNGDYNPNVPYEGLKNFDQSQQPQSWGKFTMQGIKGRFKSNYDDIAVTKKSAVLMEKDGSSYGFYKCLPVDGLRIEGAYTHVSPDWGKDPKLDYLNGPGCQFVIYFKKDGTFDDKGIFYKGGDPNTNNCPGGKGTYSIENFTITCKYNDGRVVYRLFSAPPTRNPATYDETIYIGNTAYYKKR